MNITLKPLIARVTLGDNSATINVMDTNNNVVIGPLTYHLLSLIANPVENINDRIVQLKNLGVNITSVESELSGVELR